MQTKTNKRHFFSRQSLNTFSKIAVATFFGMAIVCGLMSFYATLDQVIFMSSMMLLAALLILTRIRWMPLIACFITGLFLYVCLFKEPLPLYYLVHPRDAFSPSSLSFAVFITDVLFLWGLIVAFLSSTAALVQNYLQRERSSAPRWLNPTMIGLVVILITTILLGAILPSQGRAVAARGNGVEPLLVHMESHQFMPVVVTIPAGSSLLLFDDGSFQHTLSNGAWMNGQIHPERSTSAPVVQQASVNQAGRSLEVGTFDVPGVYHLYDANNPGMTLTIIVQ
jgi:plastocyanin